MFLTENNPTPKKGGKAIKFSKIVFSTNGAGTSEKLIQETEKTSDKTGRKYSHK